MPLGIFCRRSLTPYLDADNLFDLTKRGFAFFEEEFDCAYPFEKYDQLFAPEYNMGAMENAGCVTINEMYVFRSKVTEALVERRALTVLHELAHMWFGNLVTMRWWNDLWLNESFAEWASTTCQSEATHWTDAWTTFGTHEKDWAYRQDQLSSTHPIVAEIRDLQDVEVNFDGITYAKGASVLKQLVAYVGREPFRDGLRAYFAKHAWGNTTLDDLLSELEATSGRDLRTWSQLVARDRRGQHPAPGARGRRPGPHRRRPPSSRPARPASRRCARTPWPSACTPCATACCERTDRLELDVDGERTAGARARRARAARPAARQRRRPRLRQDPARRALAGHRAGHPRGFTSSLPRSLVLASLWDMTRDAEMGGPALRRRRARDAARRVRLHPAAHPGRPAADGGALLQRARAPRRPARLDPRPAAGRSRAPRSRAATPSCSWSAPPPP